MFLAVAIEMTRASRIISENLAASHSVRDHELAFLRIPPYTIRKAVEVWSVPPFPFKTFDFTACGPESVLTAGERKGR